jgi:probable rRNA maturation factor
MSEESGPNLDPSEGDVRVLVSNRQAREVDANGLSELAVLVLRGEGVTGPAELSLSFVEPAEMADLHVRFMGEEGPTDVLAFGMDDRGLLGDVVVCPEEAARNNPDLGAELRLLVAHGVLHLLGHDHQEEGDRRAMWAKQEAYSGVRTP